MSKIFFYETAKTATLLAPWLLFSRHNTNWIISICFESPKEAEAIKVLFCPRHSTAAAVGVFTQKNFASVHKTRQNSWLVKWSMFARTLSLKVS